VRSSLDPLRNWNPQHSITSPLAGCHCQVAEGTGQELVLHRQQDQGRSLGGKFPPRQPNLPKEEQGKPALERNQCDNFLKKLDLLEQALMKEGGEPIINGPQKRVQAGHQGVLHCLQGVGDLHHT
jgi:hypothetical protein